MSQHTIFDDIVDGSMKSWKIWEDDSHVAFLTPFPNTPGVTVVIPKENIGEYVFDLDNEQYQALMLAVKKVAKLLKKAFNADKVGLVFEGNAIPHVHAKLYPLHGQLVADDSHERIFHEEYPGYMTTEEGPLMDEQQLNVIQKQILEAAK